MPYAVGQTIVHPHHGPVSVIQISERTVNGEQQQFLDLEAIENKLTISVPVDKADDIGLRPIATTERITELLDILRAPSETQITQWSRRVKDYQARLGGGTIEDSCYVLREIIRSNPKSSASAEGQLLRKGIASIRIEVALVLDISRDEAEALIRATALEGAPQAESLPA